MKNVMTPQELFNKVSKPKIERSTFNRSHGLKTTFDSGKLIPIFIDEAMPGDTFNVKANLFGRLATPIKPVMDNIAMDIHFFSVPIRLVWDNFQKFMGEQVDPGDSTDFLMPTMTSTVTTGYGELSVYDYAGIPTKVAGLEHRSDFFRAMHLIWNEWYRDENLQDSLIVDKGDGPDTPSDYVNLLPRGKRKDYFTSALPFAQKGDAVTIPIGTSAPLVMQAAPYTDSQLIRDPNGALINTTNSWESDASGQFIHSTGNRLWLDPNGSITADLTNASAQTINALREAWQLQSLFERDARGGTRYIEMMYSHFGVLSPDARLQRPEYLGGGTSSININPIAQQGESGTTPQGNLAAMGTVAANGKGFVKSFTEHEIVIGFVSVRADLTYQQGLNKMWSRSTRYDHYFPSFANLGEEAILNKEIYAQGTAGGAADDAVFGYQERFGDYRYKPSIITGLFRSNATASLDVWHLSQDFSALPVLNNTFIEEDVPIDRVVAVTSEPEFILDAYFDFKATRPMPVKSVPGSIMKL